VCFSSGTSGKPKGVELTHFGLIASLAGIRSSDPSFYNAENRGVFFAPLCHIYGNTLVLCPKFAELIGRRQSGLNTVALMSTWIGAYVMLMKRYSLDGLLSLSAKIQANTLRIVPPIAFAMTKMSNIEQFDLSSVKYIMCSGAALQEEVIENLQKRFNKAPIFQGYG
jgi:4-coumarate--CoA ligase